MKVRPHPPLLKRTLPVGLLSDERMHSLAAGVADARGTLYLASAGEHPFARLSILAWGIGKEWSLSRRWGWELLEGGWRHHQGLPLLGFVHYEMGAFADPSAPLPMHEGEEEAGLFFAPQHLLLFNRFTQEGEIWVDPSLGGEPSWVEEGFLEEKMGSPFSPPPLPASLLLNRSDGRESYLHRIASLQRGMRRGDYYQVCLSQSFSLHASASPFDLFHHLLTRSPVPYAAYVQGGAYSLLSLSPELFFWKEGDAVITRPIKGTAPRHADPVKDSEERVRLLASEKERAELAMITDLLRNDLGKICRSGSVGVLRDRQVEAYPHFYHLVATISGRLLPTHSPISLLRSLFPGGSISGCPKSSACEAIAVHEEEARGIYTGAIGYLTPEGSAHFNLAIRTAEVRAAELEVRSGGAIGHESNPLAEYEETLTKAAPFFEALGLHADLLS